MFVERTGSWILVEIRAGTSTTRFQTTKPINKDELVLRASRALSQYGVLLTWSRHLVCATKCCAATATLPRPELVAAQFADLISVFGR